MRDRSFDIAKALGIILVVYGHALIGVASALSPDQVSVAALISIYAFHMALFFAISGAFAGNALSESPRVFGLRLLKRLIHPYIVWSVILITAHYYMSAFTNTPMTHLDYTEILHAPPAVMWYLYVLVLYFVIAWSIQRLPVFVQFGLAIALMIAGYFIDLWLLVHFRYFIVFLLALRLGPKRIRQWSTDPRIVAISSVVMLFTIAMAWFEAAGEYSEVLALHLHYVPALFAGPILVFAISAHIADRAPAESQGRQYGWISGLTAIGERTLPIYVSHILVTAGVRILLSKLGVENGYVLVIAATLAGLILPIIGYEIAKRIKVDRLLGL